MASPPPPNPEPTPKLLDQTLRASSPEPHVSRPSCTRRRRLTWGHASATWTKRRMAKARPAAQPPRCAPPPSRSPSPPPPPSSRSPSPPDGTPYWSPPAGAPHAEGLQATQCGSRVERRALTERAPGRRQLHSVAYAPAPTPRRPLCAFPFPGGARPAVEAGAPAGGGPRLQRRAVLPAAVLPAKRADRKAERLQPRGAALLTQPQLTYEEPVGL